MYALILANDFTHSGKQLWSMLTSRSGRQTVRLASNLLTYSNNLTEKCGLKMKGVRPWKGFLPEVLSWTL
jgi:hypothetical protein